MKLGMFKRVCLTVMGVGVVGSLVSVGTLATFTATSTNPGNSFTAGTLQMTNSSGCATAVAGSNTCSAVTFSALASNMKAGDTASGTVTITNTGSLPGTYTLSLNNITGSGLGVAGSCGVTTCYGLADPAGGNPIQVTIQGDTNGTASGAYCLVGRASAPTSGTCNAPSALAALTTVAIPGTNLATQWASLQGHTFTITLTLPSAAANGYQGGNVTFDLVWSATQ